jgi:hypothetical protein
LLFRLAAVSFSILVLSHNASKQCRHKASFILSFDGLPYIFISSAALAIICHLYTGQYFDTFIYFTSDYRYILDLIFTLAQFDISRDISLLPFIDERKSLFLFIFPFHLLKTFHRLTESISPLIDATPPAACSRQPPGISRLTVQQCRLFLKLATQASATLLPTPPFFQCYYFMLHESAFSIISYRATAHAYSIILFASLPCFKVSTSSKLQMIKWAASFIASSFTQYSIGRFELFGQFERYLHLFRSLAIISPLAAVTSW